MSLWAATLVASRQVLAECVEATGGFAATLKGALIHILALTTLRMSLVTLSANADTASSEGILYAALAQRTWVGIGAANSLSCGTALAVGISRGTTWTLAEITSSCVAANGVGSAGIGATLINVAATSRQGSIARVSWCTETLRLSVGQHALGVGTAVTCLAGMSAIVAHIRFRAQTTLGLITDCIARTFLTRGTAHNGHTTH